MSETSGGVTHQYRYDLGGNRTRVTYGGTGREIVSTYDALNRLATMAENGRTTGYAYNAVGAVSIRTLPNGDATTTLYDALNRATQIQGMTAASGLLYTQTMKHDLVGNVAQMSEVYPSGLANRTVVNTYDDVYRLVNESTTTSGSGTVTTAYSYDTANNRSLRVVTGGPTPGTTDYTYNSINQLTGWTDGTNTVSYTYDLNGNRATRTQGGDSDALAWDYENRLVSFDKNTGDGQGLYAFVYDYRTRRVEVIKDAAPETKFVFSGGTSVQELDGGVLSAELVRGSDIGGGVGGMLYSLRSGTPSYTHYNARGDVVAKTDGVGALTYQAAYEAWGEIKAESGSTADRQKSNSKDRDVPGYANEGFRYRDLETGAFLSKDPAGFVDGPNLYAYVRQNPWTAFDPDGLAATLVIRTPEDYQRVSELQRGGFNLYEGVKLVKGFDEDGNPNAAWAGAQKSSSWGGKDHLYGEGKFVGTRGIWFFDNKEHAAAVTKNFHEYTWITIGGQVGMTVLSAPSAGLAGLAPTASTQVTRSAARAEVAAAEAGASAAGARTPTGVIVENNAATGKASKELAQSLLEMGPKPPGTQAAHIVPTTGHIRNDIDAVRGFVTAQTKMDTYLPGMRNHAINGFWDVPGHSGTHKDIYYRALGQEFKNVSSWEDTVRALDNMRARIMAGEFN